MGQFFVCISGLIKVTEAVLKSKPEHMTLQFDYLRKARIIGLGVVSFQAVRVWAGSKGVLWQMHEGQSSSWSVLSPVLRQRF